MQGGFATLGQVSQHMAALLPACRYHTQDAGHELTSCLAVRAVTGLLLLSSSSFPFRRFRANYASHG